MKNSNRFSVIMILFFCNQIFASQPGFLENKGQITDRLGNVQENVLFEYEQAGSSMYILEDRISYIFREFDHHDECFMVEAQRIDMVLIGASSPTQIIKDNPSAAHYNFYKDGREALEARKYQSVTLKNVYQNIDWKIYQRNGKIKYDFIVQPGGDPSLIKWQYIGAKENLINADGSISVIGNLGAFKDGTPISFQANGKSIGTSYCFSGGIYFYYVEDFDRDKELIIDPDVQWFTYSGGSSFDVSNDIAGIPNDGVFIAGTTASSNFQITTQQTYEGQTDATLQKYNLSDELLYSTVFGTSGTESGNSVAVFSEFGESFLYLGGNTSSFLGLGTSGTFMPQLPNSVPVNSRGFVALFDGITGSLQASTYIAGEINAIKIAQFCLRPDAISSSFQSGRFLNIAGGTQSNSLISTNGSTYQGNTDAFLNSISLNLDNLIFGSYYGGQGEDVALCLASNQCGEAAIGGYTTSTSGIAFGNSSQNSYQGNGDAFVISERGDWGTYIGGSGSEALSHADIVIGQGGTIYFASSTNSPDGIANVSPSYQNQLNGVFDGFIVGFEEEGAKIYGTYFGGENNDFINSIHRSPEGIHFTGETNSSGLNINDGSQFNGSPGQILTGLIDFTLSDVSWSSYHGGNQSDVGLGIVKLSSNNCPYVCGSVNSAGLGTSNANQETYGGNTDGFVSLICQGFGTCPLIEPCCLCPDYKIVNDTLYAWMPCGDAVDWGFPVIPYTIFETFASSIEIHVNELIGSRIWVTEPDNLPEGTRCEIDLTPYLDNCNSNELPVAHVSAYLQSDALFYEGSTNDSGCQYLWNGQTTPANDNICEYISEFSNVVEAVTCIPPLICSFTFISNWSCWTSNNAYGFSRYCTNVKSLEYLDFPKIRPNINESSISFTLEEGSIPMFPPNSTTLLWDMGDGTTYTGFPENISHTYSDEGVYIVKLNIDFAIGIDPAIPYEICITWTCRIEEPCDPDWPICLCPRNYDPVCTPSGQKFSNACLAECAGYDMYEPENGNQCDGNLCQQFFDETYRIDDSTFDFSYLNYADQIQYFTVYNEFDPVNSHELVEVSSIQELTYTCPASGSWRFCFYYCDNGPIGFNQGGAFKSSSNSDCCDNLLMCCIDVCVDQIPQPVECGYSAVETFTESCFTDGSVYVTCGIGSFFAAGPIKIYEYTHNGGSLDITLGGGPGSTLNMKIFEGSDPYNLNSPIYCDGFFCQSSLGCSITFYDPILAPGVYLVVVSGEQGFNLPTGSSFEITFNCCDDFNSGSCAPIFHTFMGISNDTLSYSFTVSNPGFIIDDWEIDGISQGVGGNGPIFNFPNLGPSDVVEVCWIYFDPVSNCERRCCRTFCIFNPLICDFVVYSEQSNGNYLLQVTDADFNGEVEWLLDNHPGGPLVIGSGNNLEVDLSLYSSVVTGDYQVSARYGTPECWRYCCIIVPKPNLDCTDIIYELLDDGLSVNFSRPDGLVGNWEIIDLDGSIIPISFGTSQASYFNPLPGRRRICWWQIDPVSGQPEYCCRDFCIFNPFECNFARFEAVNSTTDAFEFEDGVDGQYWEVRNVETNEEFSINQVNPTFTYPGPGVYIVCGYFLNSCGQLQWCCFTRCIESNSCFLTYEVTYQEASENFTVDLEWGVQEVDSLVITSEEDPDFEFTTGALSGSGFSLPLPTSGKYRVCYYFRGAEIIDICCKDIFVYPCWSWRFRPVGGDDQTYRFENQGEFPVDRWELEDSQGNLIGTFSGNNVNINFGGYGEYFITPVIVFPDLCEGYRGCRRQICINPVFGCNVILPRPAPTPIPFGGFRYDFSLDIDQIPNAQEAFWFVEDIPGLDVEGLNASFAFGPQFYGREIVVSVVYYDGFCWRICCIVICILDPFACDEIVFRPTPSPLGLVLEFELPSLYEEVFWDLHSLSGQSFDSGIGSSFTVNWNNFDVEELVISVSYFDPISGCRRLCCRRLCLPDPLRCNRILVRPGIEPLSNGSFIYEAILDDIGTDIEWYWHDADGNIINNAQGNGVNAAIEFLGNFEGDVFITYRYFSGGCWKVCCQRICVRNPYNCGLIFWTLSPGGSQGVNYTFRSELELDPESEWEWEISNAMSGAIVLSSSDVSPTLNLELGNMYHIIFRYFDPISNCWVLCCRKVCVEDPFACTDIEISPRAVLGGPVYTATLQSNLAEDIYWQVDEDLDNNQTGGFSFEVDFSQYASGTYNITVFYRVGDCWFACCRRLCINNPLTCTLFNTSTGDDDNEVVINNPESLPVVNYYVFNSTGDSLDILDGSSTNYILPGTGNYWFCAYYFINGCWQYCCFDYNDCDSNINCNDIIFTSDGTDGTVLLDGSLSGGFTVDSVIVSSPVVGTSTLVGFPPSFNCQVPGTYEFCFYYVNECGFVDFCCIEYCADNFVFPCGIRQPELVSDGMYLIRYEGDEEVLSWEIDGDIVAENVQELVYSNPKVGEYQICVIRRTPCGRILEKCCRTYCLDNNMCNTPTYTVNESTLSVTFTGINSDSLEIYDEGGSLIGGVSLIGLSNYTYAVPGNGFYTFCFSYLNPCGAIVYCCTDLICFGVNRICLPFEVNVNNLGVELSLDRNSNEVVNWDFGDGNIGIGAFVSHTYSQAGSYKVCYTVLSECGSCTFCEDVVVVPDGVLAVKYGKVVGLEDSFVELPVIVVSGSMEDVSGFQFFFEVEKPAVAIPVSINSVPPFTNFASLIPISGSSNRFGAVASISTIASNVVINEGDTLIKIRFELLGNRGDTTEIKFWSDDVRINTIADSDSPPNTFFPVLIDGCIIISGQAQIVAGNVTTWPPERGINNVEVLGVTNQGSVFFSEISNTEGRYSSPSLFLPNIGLNLSAKKDERQSMASLAGQVQAAAVVKYLSDTNTFINQGQYIAADINCDGMVNIFDAFAILQLTFNLGTPLINQTCLDNPWIFIPKNLVADPVSNSNWYPFPTEYPLSEQFEERDGDFYGIHRGDIMGFANLSRSTPLVLLADEAILEQGQEYSMEINGLNFKNITSFGVGITFDTSKVDFLGFEPIISSLAGHDIVIDQDKIDDGILAIGWVYFDLVNPNGVSLTEEDLVFTLRWRAKTGDVQLIRDIVYDPNVHPSVGTDRELNVIPVIFSYDRSVNLIESVNSEYALYQNQPNPFETNTIVSFLIPHTQEVQIDLYDSYGRNIKSHRSWYSAGLNQLELNLSDSGGIYYYKMTTQDFIATKKMIKN